MTKSALLLARILCIDVVSVKKSLSWFNFVSLSPSLVCFSRKGKSRTWLCSDMRTINFLHILSQLASKHVDPIFILAPKGTLCVCMLVKVFLDVVVLILFYWLQIPRFILEPSFIIMNHLSLFFFNLKNPRE